MDDVVFQITEAAQTELQNRLNASDSHRFIRLEMRNSCLMKLKLTLQESIQPNDVEVMNDDLHFIIDKGECYYFRNKTIDFIPDPTGFKQFEVI